MLPASENQDLFEWRPPGFVPATRADDSSDDTAALIKLAKNLLATLKTVVAMATASSGDAVALRMLAPLVVGMAKTAKKLSTVAVLPKHKNSNLPMLTTKVKQALDSLQRLVGSSSIKEAVEELLTSNVQFDDVIDRLIV